ncbi:uncharacterized protein LOC127836694 isoform X3 [Dreissena polymorpha]|uniref:uncharacterized protein LOC127836694 isoform X3 n=1 Tax=Dreissena polymorpha TaxID=45954 RepID=UPI0022654190|nr:uncharacterized protein LOC127836694 isoform X3 [Dreissena polymorpha]
MYQDHHRHFINNKFNRGSTCFQEASTASGMLYNDARLSLDGGCKSNCIETDPNKYAGLPQRNYPPCQLNRCKTDGEFLLNCFVNDFTEKIQLCKGILLTCCKINCSKELCLLSVDKNQTNDNRNLVSCLLNTESQNNQIREGNRNKEINISDSANLEYSCIRSSIECKQDDLFQSKTSEIVAESSADKCETSDNHSLFKEHVILECDNAIKFTACAHCGMALTDTSFFSNFKTDILPSSTDRCKAHTLSAINVAENSADFTRNKFCTCNQRREGYENLIRKNIRTGMSFHEEGINEESSALDYWSDKRDLSEKSRDLNNEMAESEFAWECTWYSDEHMSDKKSFQNYNLKYYRDAQPDKMSGLSPVKITTQKCIANQVFPEEIKESRDSIAGFESRRTQKISGHEEYNCIVRSESGASLNERRIDCNLSTLEASRDRDSRNEINLNQPEQSLQSTREHGKFDVSDSKISAECKIECHELGLNQTNFSLGFNECEILQPPCEKTFASAKTECPCLSTYGAGLNHLEFSNQASGGLANDNPVSTLGARCHISKIVNNASDVSSNHLQSNRSLVLKDVKLSDIDVADLNLVCGFKGHVLENSAEICAELNQNKYSNNIISSSEHVEGSVNNETTNDLDLIDETSRTDVNETDTTSSNQRLSLTSSGSCVSDSSERFVDAPEEPLDLIIESHSTHDVIDNVTLPEQGNLSQHTVQSDLLSGIGERKQENSSDESDVILCDTSLTPSSTFGHELLKLEAGECLYKFSNKSSSVDSFHDAVEHLDDDFLTSFNTSTSIREDTDDTSSLTSSKSTTSLDNYSEWDDFDDDLEDILKYDETMANERTDERDDSKIALNQASAGNSSVYFRRNILKDNAYLKTVASANGDVRYAPTSRNILRSNDAQKDSVSKVIGNIISKNNYDRQVQENGCSGTERKNDAGCGFKQQNDVNFTHTDASKMRDVISETSKGQLNKNNDNASASSESGKDVSTKVSCVNKNDVNINVASKIETALVKRNERRRRKRIERQINGMTSGVTCSTHVESSESGVHIFREEKNQACIITHNESIHGSSVQNSSNIETVCQNTDKPQSGWKTEPVCETKSAPVSEKLNITDSDSASLKHNASSLKKLNDPEYQNAENKCAATKNTAEVACLEIDLQINNSIKSESDDYPMEEKLVCKNCENKTSNMETGFKTSISDKVQNFKENELDDIEFIDADCTDAIEDSNRPVNDINIMQKGQNPDHVMTSESDGLVTHCVIHDDVTVAKEETPSPNVTYTLTYEDDDRAEAFVYEVVREEKSKANNECNHSESCHDTVSDTSHQSAEASRHHSDTIPTRNDDVIKSNDGVIKSSDEIINSHLGHNMSSEHTTMYRDCATGFLNEKATESVICNGELKSESVAIVSYESNNVKEAEISEESNISVKHALELERQKMKTVKESSNMKSTFTNKRSGRRNTAENIFETNNDGREENGAIESKDVAKKPFTAIRKSKSFRFERNIEPENVAAEKTKDNESPQLPKKVSDICLNFMTKARSAATRTRTQTASESPAPNRKLMKWVVDNGKWMRIPISADDDESEAMVNSKPEDHDENDSQRHVMERKTVIKASNNDTCIRLTKSENIEQNKNIVLEDVIVTINNTIEIETESSYNCVNGVNTDATKAFTIVEDQSLKTHDSQANQNIPVAILVLNTTVDRLVKASDDENALSPNKTDAKEIIQNDIQTLHITEQRLHEKKTNVTSNDEITEDKIEEHSESKPLKALVFNSETDLKKPTLKQRLFRNDQSNFADVIISEEGLNDGFRKSSRLLDQKVEQIGETVINENIENDVKIIGTALDEAKCGTEKHQIRQELLFGILDSFNRRKPRKMYRSPVRIPAQNDFASQMKLPEAIQGTSNSRRTEPSNNITQVHMGGNDASSIPKLKAVKIDEEIFESETPNPCDVEGKVLSSGLESIRRNSFRHETIHNSLDSIDRGKVMALHMRKSKTFAGLCAEDRDDDNNHRYEGMRETESTSRSSAVNASQNDDVSDVPLRVKSPEQIARQQQRHKRTLERLLSEIAEVEESREGVTATFESKREHHHKHQQQQQQPQKQPQRPRSSKDQQRGQTPLPRGNKHRSLSLPTGTLAFGNTRIVYKDGHFTFETMATNDLDFHNEQTGFQGSADNVSMPETSPEEYSREAIQSFRSSPREATKMHNKPSLRRQIGKAALANGESQEDVFYADGDDHIQNKCLSEEFSLSNLAPCLDDYMNESYLSNYSENNLTVSDRLSVDSDDKFESQIKKLSSSSLPEGVKDEEVKRVMQRAKRTSSFRQAQEVGSLRLSGIMEDAIHNSSRSSVVAIDDSGTNSGNNSPSVQNQSSTFIKKMMAKRKSANENLSLTTANKPSESAKDFFSKKVNFKGFFKKNKSDSSVSASPLKIDHPTSPPIAVFHQDDIESVATPPSSPYANREFRRRHTSADIYPSKPHSDSGEVDSNCPTPTQERCNFRQSVSNPTTPIHELNSNALKCVYARTKQVGTVTPRDDDQMSVSSACSISSSIQSPPPLEQPSKPKTPKPATITASPRRNPSSSSSLSRLGSQSSIKARNNSFNSLDCDINIDDARCECDLPPRSATLGRRRRNSDLTLTSTDSSSMCQYCTWMANSESVGFSYRSLGRPRKRSVSKDKMSERSPVARKDSYDRLGIIMQTDVTSSNSNDSGIQRDVSADSSNESLKAVHEGHICIQRDQSTSPHPDRSKSEVGVRWADVEISDTVAADMTETSVVLRHHEGFSRPRPVSCVIEGSSCLFERLRALGSEINLQPYGSLRNLYEMRRRDIDRQKNRRMSTPHPIKSRLQRSPQKLQKQPALVRSSSMPECLDKLHKRRKMHHLLDFHMDNLSKHNDNDSLSGDSDLSFDQTSLQGKSLSVRSSTSQLTGLDEYEDALTYAEALWDHITMDQEELVFRAQDLIEVVDMADRDWWYGVIEDREGWFPAAFVRIRVNQIQMEDDIDTSFAAPLLASPKLRRISIMNKDQARTNVVNEIINAEREYVKHLKDVVEGYIQHARKRTEMFPEARIQLIFGNIETIYKFALKFVGQLETCIDVCPHLSEIGQCFLDNERGFEIYSDYCNNHPSACEELKELCRDSKYKHFFEACRLLQELVEIPLEGFLLTPVQKICKYPLQLAELLKYTPPEHPDFGRVQAALSAMRKIARLINERKRKMESIEKIAAWQHSVVDWEGGDLLERSSELIFSGELTKVNSAGWAQERAFFLFDHQIIYCKKDLLKRHVFIYKGRIDLDHCDVIDLEDGKDHQYNTAVKNAWKFHETRKDKWYLVCAKNAATKQRWLKAIQDQRQRVIEDQENDFCVPDHWKQTVLNKVRSHSNLKDKHSSRRPLHGQLSLHKDFKDSGYSLLPRQRISSSDSKGDKKGFWSKLGGGKKTKR